MRARQVEVLERLLSGEGRHTLKALAAAVQVSSRTLQRELPFYARWLGGFGIRLRPRPRLGVEVQATPEERQAALEALRQVRPVRALTPAHRQGRILEELLQSRGETKLAYFARRFGVTESTISSDLDHLEPWLQARGLALVRRPGAGIRVEGSEQAFRTAIVDYVRENLTEEQLYALLRQVAGEPAAPGTAPAAEFGRSRLLPFTDAATIARIEAAVRGLAADLDEPLADSAVAGLVVHLALAVARLRRGEGIHFPPETLAALRPSREWRWAQELARRVSEAAGLALPEDEVGYIAMHLKGARVRAAPETWDLPDPVRAEALLLARAMVQRAGERLGLPVGRVPGLVQGLAVHLVPAISRLRLGLEIRNPLLGQIRSEYPELFEVSRAVCQVLGDHLGCPIPDAEVGFVTMHLGAAVERLQAEGRPRYRALLVCATGVGSSQMLASRLAKALPEVEVTDVTAVLELPGRLRRGGNPPDVILSTVPLDLAEVPVVVVSPLLRAEDVAAIRAVLAKAGAAGAGPRQGTTAPEPEGRYRAGPGGSGAYSDAAARIRRAARMGPVVWHLTEGFWLHEGAVQDPVAAAARRAAQAGLTARPGVLEADLRRREALGPTAVTDWLRLLHARSGAVERPLLGLVRTPAPGPAWLVMAVPDPPAPEVREALSTVSAALVERPDFVEALRTQSEGEIRQVLAEILQPLLFHADGIPTEEEADHVV